MEALKIYTAKNLIEHQRGWLGSPIAAHQAIVYTVNPADGLFSVPLNGNAPLRSDFIPERGYIFEINQVIVNNKYSQDNALPAADEKKIIVGFISGLVLSFVVKTKNDTPNDIAQESEIFVVLNGKLKNRFFNIHGHNFLNIVNNAGRFSTKPQNKNFLTTAPAQKLTDINIPEYLYFLTNIQNCPEKFFLKAAILYEDKSSETLILDEMTGVVVNNVILFNVSLSLILTKANSLKQVSEYRVYVADGNNIVLSEKRTFIVDPQTQEITYNLLFRNNLGVFETARFVGERDEYLDFNIDSFETRNQVIDYYSEAVTKLNFRTGNLQQDWLTYLAEEISASKEIYWLLGKERIRLAHTGKNLKTYDSKNIQESAIFEFRIAQTEINQ